MQSQVDSRPNSLNESSELDIAIKELNIDNLDLSKLSRQSEHQLKPQETESREQPSGGNPSFNINSELAHLTLKVITNPIGTVAGRN